MKTRTKKQQKKKKKKKKKKMKTRISVSYVTKQLSLGPAKMVQTGILLHSLVS